MATRFHLAARAPNRLKAAAAEFGETTVSAVDVVGADLFARATLDAGAALAGLVHAVATINFCLPARSTRADSEADFRINALAAVSGVRAPVNALNAGEAGVDVVLISTLAARQGFLAQASVAMAEGQWRRGGGALPSDPRQRRRALTDSRTARRHHRERQHGPGHRRYALQRLNEPEDVGRLAASLVSDEAAWIIGQIIGADGGCSTLLTWG